MNARLAKASIAFGRLYKNVWNRSGIKKETKIKVYRAVVLTTLLYEYEWLTTGRKACPWCPIEAIQGQSKGLPQGIQCQP